ncbi:SIS domain-containing protein [Pradoshia eiseniae]|uniref:SIS domain-containing protein n=1 Tax=Pradoshia eiseniae TaxID=2064768 RepID=A0A2S7N3R0_9BACI|nr:SIS domain-containing protein [Pradoshia eiseniae]PQD96657.1 SIS domain-containing protein [Pradoshia eiseniae]
MSFMNEIEKEVLEGAKHTAREISQQPELWQEAFEAVETNKDVIKAFLREHVFSKNARIIFTGAGTSAYVGDTASPLLRRKLSNQVESVATTDIVSNPLNYLKPDQPTVLISFARSGNSPESVATYDLAKQLVADLSQIIITCNPEGKLAEAARQDEKTLLLLMPEESNDQGFAMTSSFSCMYLTALSIFQLDNLGEWKKKVQLACDNTRYILESNYKEIIKLVQLEKKKVVYLGSSTLKGLAQETSLKNLELASGKIPTFFESVLGFRHGPKSIVDDETLLFVFMSNDSYTRKYELDLLRELKNDGGAKTVVAISNFTNDDLRANSDVILTVPEDDTTIIEDDLIALNYLVFGQLFALFNSIHLGVTPDNPSPSGIVNRVVKGVEIYNFS